MPQRSLNQNFNAFGNYTLAVSASSQATAITQPTSGQLAKDCCVSNGTTAVIYVAWSSTGTATATTSSLAILPGAIEVIDMGPAGPTSIAILGSASAGTVYFSVGTGC